MKQLTLERKYKDDRTTGTISIPNGDVLTTLERPWLDNKVSVSCIPEGDYIARRDRHGRFKWFSVQDVEGRTFIELHEGSKPEHSEGCILLSVADLNKLIAWTGEDSFILTVKEFQPIIFGG